MKGVFDKNLIRKWDVYKIENPNGQVYIGCTCVFQQRMWKYKRMDCKKQPRLYDSLVKYGYDSHKITIIDSFESSHSYSKGKEIFWIRTYMSNYEQFSEMRGLNKGIGGGFATHLQTQENRRKAIDKIMNNPEIRQRRNKNIGLANLGRKHSEQAILNIRKAKQIESGKSFIQYSLTGEFIKEWASIRDAHRNGVANRNTIINQLRGGVKTPKNYIFKYKDKVEFTKVVLPRRIFKQQEIKTA